MKSATSRFGFLRFVRSSVCFCTMTGLILVASSAHAVDGVSTANVVALGDLNGDLYPDAVVAKHRFDVPARILINNGAGGFVEGQTLETEFFDPTWVMLGDVDGDADLDIVAVRSGSPSGGTMQVWTNDAGNFVSGPLFGPGLAGFGPFINGAALGQLDGASGPDLYLLVSDETSANQVWTNDGSGVFADSGQRLGTNAGFDVDLGDVDGDGDLDAFVLDRIPDQPPPLFTAGTGHVWRNNGNGVFTLLQNLPAPGLQTFTKVSLGHFNNDTNLDAFIIDDYQREGVAWTNNGNVSNPQFVRGNHVDIFNPDSGEFDIVAADFDGDSDLDVIVSDRGALTLLLTNNGTATFGIGPGFLPQIMDEAVLGCALADLDRDGDLDGYFVHNYAEEQVWINPRLTPSPQSTLLNIAPGGNHVMLWWFAELNNTYQLQQSTNGVTSFQPMGSSLPGTGGFLTNLVTLSNNAAYYRLQISN